MLPKDPVMLLSVVNTRLRDVYPSLEALCEGEETSKEALDAALNPIGYNYDDERKAYV